MRLAKLERATPGRRTLKPAKAEGDWQPAKAHQLATAHYLIPVDEFAEVELPGLRSLTREEFRAVCDREKTKEAIVAALRSLELRRFSGKERWTRGFVGVSPGLGLAPTRRAAMIGGIAQLRPLPETWSFIPGSSAACSGSLSLTFISDTSGKTPRSGGERGEPRAGRPAASGRSSSASPHWTWQAASGWGTTWVAGRGGREAWPTPS